MTWALPAVQYPPAVDGFEGVVRNLRLSVVAAFLLCSAASAAVAACPDEQTARNGFKLESHDPDGQDIEVRPFDGETVSFIGRHASDSSRPLDEVTTWRGIIQLKIKGQAETTIEIAADYRSLYPIRAGATFNSRFTARTGDRSRTASFKMQVAPSATTLAVGDCTYEVWRISRQGDFDDGERYLIIDYYAPVLAMWLRRDTVLVRPGQDIVLRILAFKAITSR